MRLDPIDPERVYRAFRFGPLVDVFMLDERSYRGANAQPAGWWRDADFLGPGQTAWLKAGALRPRARWKVIASDMPYRSSPDLNPDVPKGTFEAWATLTTWCAVGRELEIADLLRFIGQQKIRTWSG